jgi:predicted nucleic acid-binding protein
MRRPAGRINPQESAIVQQLTEYLLAGQTSMLGVVRQELLSGIKEDVVFNRVRERLRFVPTLVTHTEDYEQAAVFSNFCRRRGLAATLPDLLICACASRRDWPVFTTDRDFERFSKILPIRLA